MRVGDKNEGYSECIVMFLFPESLHSQWQQYEESYEKLSQWIKDMEASMKADSELKSTVDDKKTQLDKQKVCLIYKSLQIVNTIAKHNFSIWSHCNILIYNKQTKHILLWDRSFIFVFTKHIWCHCKLTTVRI